MRRPTLTAIVLSLLLLLLGASGAALAATFEGRGRDDRKVEVSFEKAGDEIKRFKIERAKFFCTHRRPFRELMRAGEMHLTEDSEFRGRFTNSNGRVLLRVRGELVDRLARGSFRATVYFRLGRCTTRRVEWSARPGR